ncbi:hypothetical protein OXV40_34580, partial [Burkholderia contaminans]|uniref:hypothetical protein n=1 Tax=Burkholderia contaminans TaxID=488447 RepID=UPI002D809B37
MTQVNRIPDGGHTVDSGDAAHDRALIAGGQPSHGRIRAERVHAARLRAELNVLRGGAMKQRVWAVGV